MEIFVYSLTQRTPGSLDGVDMAEYGFCHVHSAPMLQVRLQDGLRSKRHL